MPRAQATRGAVGAAIWRNQHMDLLERHRGRWRLELVFVVVMSGGKFGVWANALGKCVIL